MKQALPLSAEYKIFTIDSRETPASAGQGISPNVNCGTDEVKTLLPVQEPRLPVPEPNRRFKSNNENNWRV